MAVWFSDRGEATAIEIETRVVLTERMRNPGDDPAIEWLEKAFADLSSGLLFLKMEPELDELRSNPRFITLQQKLGFSIV